MNWYEKLDYDENPFEVETKTIGFDNILDEVFYAVMAGNIVFLEGTTGSGKTKILKEAIRKFGGKGRVVYVNCKKLNKELNVELLLKNRNGILRRLFGKKPKNMIVLLDEIEHMSPQNCERIKYLYDQNYIRSILFASTNFEKVGLPESLVQRISKVIPIEPLSDYEAVQLIREKIGDELLSDRIIKEVYKLSDKNVRKFLENCDKVCSQSVDKKDLSEDDVRNILAVKK